jgi:hypothetical protein
MNSIEWITFYKLMLNAPNEAEKIQAERRNTFKCVEQKQCISVWSKSQDDWVAYRIENLKEVCSSYPQIIPGNDPDGACEIYYNQFLKRKSDQN